MKKAGIYGALVIIGMIIGFFMHDILVSPKKISGNELAINDIEFNNNSNLEDSDSLTGDLDKKNTNKSSNNENSSEDSSTENTENNSDDENFVSDESEDSEDNSNDDSTERFPEIPDGDDDDDIIIGDRLVLSTRLDVEMPDNVDPDASELLEMNAQAFSDKMTVEFWESPLGITGYELSRNRLKLFGFNPNDKISLSFATTTNELLLNTERMSLSLQKTNRFHNLNLK